MKKKNYLVYYHLIKQNAKVIQYILIRFIFYNGDEWNDLLLLLGLCNPFLDISGEMAVKTIRKGAIKILLPPKKKKVSNNNKDNYYRIKMTSLLCVDLVVQD